jgi:hypothetical protein
MLLQLGEWHTIEPVAIDFIVGLADEFTVVAFDQTTWAPVDRARLACLRLRRKRDRYSMPVRYREFCTPQDRVSCHQGV